MTKRREVDGYHLWIGRSEQACVRIEADLLHRFEATFDIERGATDAGEPAPLGIHWCLGSPVDSTADLAPDGHPARGAFLPPIELPRRMWAGGDLTFGNPLRAGETLVRTSRIADVTSKEGRSGALVFVTITHEYTRGGDVALTERQDIVYREAPRSRGSIGTRAEGNQSGPSWVWMKLVRPDPVLLFRYSAVTFNAHRIHYDRRYCIEQEGYPDLVVHGPLQATLLLRFATEIGGGARPRRFAFRSEAPLFGGAPFQLAALPVDGGLTMCTLDGNGGLAMSANVSW